MLNRRSLLVASSVLPAAALSAQPAMAQQTANGCAEFSKWDFTPSDPLPPGSSTTNTGTRESRHEEVAKGFGLLFKSPRQATPIAVARYFEAIKDKNRDNELYNVEWKVRANPVIVGFFSMTNTMPSEGDQTSWCAAFVNFCLGVSDRKMTGSALSGSFRTYQKQTDDPKEGDIVVFADSGPKGAQGFGHVGLYVSRDANGITVLGGNQRGNTGTTGAVTLSKFPYRGGSLTFHSYRSVT